MGEEGEPKLCLFYTSIQRHQEENLPQGGTWARAWFLEKLKVVMGF